jgi:nitrate/TMAO reductase-like tetraheme cytochrome c subunit
MFRFLRHFLSFGVLVGFVVGVLVVLGAERMDVATSSDAFCGTSCHSMQAHVVSDEAYQSSAHRTAASGVRAGCADCHIPAGLVPATWTHVTAGIKDMWSEMTNDFENKEVWDAKRPELAYGVRDWLLRTDSGTCRKCHDEAQIEPGRKSGQREHAKALEQGITCIACHYNLVHEEVKPRDSFLEKSMAGTKG